VAPPGAHARSAATLDLDRDLACEHGVEKVDRDLGARVAAATRRASPNPPLETADVFETALPA
jgi:hypothetical protein